MTRLLSFLSIVVLLSLVLSCEKELRFDRNLTTNPRLYANCLLNPDSIYRAYISYTINITDPISDIQDKIDKAQNALVVITDTVDNISDTLQCVGKYSDESSFLVFESLTGTRPQFDRSYKLEVSEPFNPKNRMSTNYTLTPDDFDSVTLTPLSPLVQIIHTDATFRFELEWENPVSKDNFFIIEGIFKITHPQTGDIEYIRANLYSTSSNNDNGSISDHITNEFLYLFFMDRPGLNTTNITKTKIAVVTAPYENAVDNFGQNNIDAEIIVRVLQVNKPTYDYYHDVENYRKNNNTSIFSLPIIVQGNIQGVGLFGAQVIREVVYTLP